MKICEHWRPSGHQLNLILYYSQNEFESKLAIAEFKTSAKLNVMYNFVYNLLAQKRTLIKTVIEWLTFLFVKSKERGGHWGILETAKPKKKSSKTAKPSKYSAKTENLTYSQNRKTRKQHWIIKPKNRYYFLRKPKTGC